MTRANKTPAIRKPVFEEEAVLRFAEGPMENKGKKATAAGDGAGLTKGGKKSHPERTRLELEVKGEVLDLLATEAKRKERTVDQVVEKLVLKHLGKK